MSDSDRYTTISVHKGIRDDLKRLKGDDETYTDILHRALASLSKQEDKEKRRWEYHDARTAEQTRLLVRMADELGMEADQIPNQMAASEKHGKTDTLEDVFQPPDEAVSDVKRGESEQDEGYIDDFADEGSEH